MLGNMMGKKEEAEVGEAEEGTPTSLPSNIGGGKSRMSKPRRGGNLF